MDNIHLTARFKIHNGQLARFKELARSCISIVTDKEKGNGNLQYDWFITADGAECIVREIYQDSNALLAHMQNVGAQLGSIMKISDFSGELCGNPSLELKEAMAGLDVTTYQYFAGME